MGVITALDTILRNCLTIWLVLMVLAAIGYFLFKDMK